MAAKNQVASRQRPPVSQTDTVVLTGSSSSDLREAIGVLAGRRGAANAPDRVLLPMGFREFVTLVLGKNSPRPHRTIANCRPGRPTTRGQFHFGALVGSFGKHVGNIPLGRGLSVGRIRVCTGTASRPCSVDRALASHQRGRVQKGPAIRSSDQDHDGPPCQVPGFPDQRIANRPRH